MSVELTTDEALEIAVHSTDMETEYSYSISEAEDIAELLRRRVE